MAVTNGNRESVVKNTSPSGPAWRVLEWFTAHSPPPPSVASGDVLLIVISYANNMGIDSVTHNGDDLTRVDGGWLSSAGIRQEYWYLDTPETGVRDIEVTFTTTIFNGISVCAMCFNGATGIGNIIKTDISNTPHTESLSVSSGSAVYTTIASTGAHTSITIDGNVTLPANFEPNQSNVNRIVSGAWSTTPTSAGNINITGTQPFGSISLSAIEVLETTPVITRRRIMTV